MVRHQTIYLSIYPSIHKSIHPSSYRVYSSVSVTPGAELVLSGLGRSVPAGELHPYPEETDPGGASAAGG